MLGTSRVEPRESNSRPVFGRVLFLTLSVPRFLKCENEGETVGTGGRDDYR